MSVMQKNVQWPDAQRVLDAALKKAEECKQAVSVAVVDAAGHLVAFGRMDNAMFGSIDLAIDLAWTACAFRAETSRLNKRADTEASPQYAARAVLAGGGVPLLQDRIPVGAVGVSGASDDLNQEIAQAAAGAF